MNYTALLNLKAHLTAKLGFWMSQGRSEKVNEYRKELATVEAAIDTELQGDVILG